MVLKTRLQDRPTSGATGHTDPRAAATAAAGGPRSRPATYASTAQCARLIWRREGARAFYRGCVPYALRAAPASAVTFVVYEECMRLQRGRSGGGAAAAAAS
jgi:Mitochondrial carrier protein